MKGTSAVLIGIFLLAIILPGYGSGEEEFEEVLVVYYFGATNCGFCTAPENIKKIKKIKTDFSMRDKGLKAKFVMVCMDEDIKEGLKFIKKYGYWDEISIGGFYKNELALYVLNRARIPGVPHILVFQDTLARGRWNIPVLKKRKLLVDLVGGKEIEDWIEHGYPLSNNKFPDFPSSTIIIKRMDFASYIGCKNRH
jgi:hypothetical protein